MRATRQPKLACLFRHSRLCLPVTSSGFIRIVKLDVVVLLLLLLSPSNIASPAVGRYGFPRALRHPSAPKGRHCEGAHRNSRCLEIKKKELHGFCKMRSSPHQAEPGVGVQSTIFRGAAVSACSAGRCGSLRGILEKGNQRAGAEAAAHGLVRIVYCI